MALSNLRMKAWKPLASVRSMTFASAERSTREILVAPKSCVLGVNGGVKPKMSLVTAKSGDNCPNFSVMVDKSLWVDVLRGLEVGRQASGRKLGLVVDCWPTKFKF
eukprot:2819626-Prymnesium_polylepis.1